MKRLRWLDIDWTQNRFTVYSPKTERYEGHEQRIVPLFSELRIELEKHYSLDETKGNEFVIGHYQGTSWNFSTNIQTIARRAGLGTMVRPFDNMRMNRSNEVENKFGSKKESLWIGHSAELI